MTPWLTLIGLLTACTASKDAADTAEEEIEETEETEEQESQTVLDLEPGINEITVEQEVEGEMVDRNFLVHVSENFDGTGSSPLLFAFHGAGGNGSQFIQQYTSAIENGDFIGVYPDGLETSWNIGREDSKADDIAFVYIMMDLFENTPGVDISKPVGTGFSNGAALTHKIGIETDLFVAIVPQVSQMIYENQPQPDGASLSVMQFMGTEDDFCPYEGGTGVLGYDFMPAEESAATWASHNGCDDTATSVDIGDHVKMEWENCSNGRRVIHYRMNDVGHEVPPDIDGNTSDRIIEFLLEARQ